MTILTWNDLTVLDTKHNTYRLLLNNVSGIARSGEVTFILRSRSAGNSILLQALAGRLDSSKYQSIQGQIWQDNYPRSATVQMKSTILIDPGQTTAAFLPGHSLRETMAICGSIAGISPPYHEILQKLSLTAMADRGLTYNAQGQAYFLDTEEVLPSLMRHLVHLALSLLCSPTILLLDDIFTTLDREETLILMDILKTLAYSQDLLIICSSSNDILELVRAHKLTSQTLCDGKRVENEEYMKEDKCCSISTVSYAGKDSETLVAVYEYGCDSQSKQDLEQAAEAVTPAIFRQIRSLLRVDRKTIILSGSLLTIVGLSASVYSRSLKYHESDLTISNGAILAVCIAPSLLNTVMLGSTWSERQMLYTYQLANMKFKTSRVLGMVFVHILCSYTLRAISMCGVYTALAVPYQNFQSYGLAFATLSMVFLISESLALFLLGVARNLSRARTLIAGITSICGLAWHSSSVKSTTIWHKLQLVNYIFHAHRLLAYALYSGSVAKLTEADKAAIESVKIGDSFLAMTFILLPTVGLLSAIVIWQSLTSTREYDVTICDERIRTEVQERTKLVTHRTGSSCIIAPRFDVIIIGAGASGLVVAAKCKARGLSHLIVEKGPRIGERWHHHYPWAPMSTPKEYVGLPGHPIPQCIGNSFTYAEFASYLEDYAHAMELNILVNHEVESTCQVLDDTEKMSWEVKLSDKVSVLRSKYIIVCTGKLNQPHIPKIPGIDRFVGYQCHSDLMQDHKKLHGRSVLVIGAGMASLQVGNILTSFSDTNVIYAFRRMPALLPSRAWGISIFWMANEFSWLPRQVMDLTQSLVATMYYGLHYTRLFPTLTSWKFGRDRRIPTIDMDGMFVAALKAGRASVVSGPKSIWEEGFVDLDGSVYKCDVIIWATGYTLSKPGFISEEACKAAKFVGWSQHSNVPIAVATAEAERITHDIARECGLK